jgi:hypothetical protein
VQINTIENITIEGIGELSILDNALSNDVFFSIVVKMVNVGYAKHSC